MKSQEPGTAAYTLRENPGFRFRWTRMNMELDTEPQEQKNPAVGEVPERDILVGDIVQHFKREWVSSETSEYLYKVLAFAQHTETGEKLVVYQGMYPPFKICARPYDMFMSEVDREKYPKIRQKYRFEKIKL